MKGSTDQCLYQSVSTAVSRIASYLSCRRSHRSRLPEHTHAGASLALPRVVPLGLEARTSAIRHAARAGICPTDCRRPVRSCMFGSCVSALARRKCLSAKGATAKKSGIVVQPLTVRPVDRRCPLNREPPRTEAIGPRTDGALAMTSARAPHTHTCTCTHMFTQGLSTLSAIAASARSEPCTRTSGVGACESVRSCASLFTLASQSKPTQDKTCSHIPCLQASGLPE